MITVFTSSFNYGKYLRKSIESVLSQTYRDFEYHLIDYGSIDNTWEIINSYKDDRIKAIQIGCQKNKTFAMNHSIRISKSGYWSWCPADDHWQSSLLERKIEYSLKYPDAVLYDDFWVIDDSGRVVQEVELPSYSCELIKTEIWKRSLIGFTGIFIPVSLLKELPFPEWENISEDYAWMIQAVGKGIDFIRVPEKLHYKRNHPGSVTDSRYAEVIANMSKIWERLRNDT
jgi:glycosyltransferase involved in cell wall biosynthesis